MDFNKILNLISENKDGFLTIGSALTFIFSIFTFLRKEKKDIVEKNISNILMMLENFYSPLIARKNEEILFSKNLKEFYFNHTFFIDSNINLLCTELIELEKDIDKLNTNKVLMKKYLKTRNYFLKIIQFAYDDLTKIHNLEFFSLKPYYYFSKKIKFIFYLLDSLALVSILIIITIFIFALSFVQLITLIFFIDVLWVLYRSQILSISKKYINSSNSIFKIFNFFNIYFYNQISPSDAIYINIFSKKSFYIYIKDCLLYIKKIIRSPLIYFQSINLRVNINLMFTL